MQLKADPFLLQSRTVSQYLQSNQLGQAEHELLMALAQHPESPSAMRLMGSLQSQLGNFRAASEWIERYLTYCPTDSLALMLLASTLEQSGRTEQSHALFERAIACAKTFQDFFEISVEADREGLAEIALRAVDKSISLLPSKAYAGQTYLQRARILQTIGRGADAAKIYRELIRKNMVSARAWFALLDLKTEQLSASEYLSLAHALERATNAQDRTLIGFALGKAHEDAANFSAAFATFKRANDSAAILNSWNSGAFTKHAAQVLEAFASAKIELPDSKSNGTFGSELIFLVGLPRSGTTLVEQVLSAHPDVEGANELPHLPLLIQQESQRRGTAYPIWVEEMTALDWRRLGAEYLSLTARWRTRRPKSTDKLPENWLYIGAIALMFPGSKIIDCLRDPVETVWSCYKQLFAPGRVNFSYKFEDLRDFWLSYRESMEVWGQRLPNQLCAQSYEMLVFDTEKQVRALLDFCGLAFSDACLQPHLAQRVIRTPSASQVRLPMHAPSAKVQGYGEHLASLRTLFN